jgi:hypothetical protein
MNPALKNYGVAGLVFLAGVLAGVSLTRFGGRTLGSPDAGQQIDPGSETFSILDEEVMSLTYTTAALRLTAQRSKPADRFAVQVTFSDGRKPQQCFASPDLAGQLSNFSAITAKREVQPHQVELEFPVQMGKLELRDRILTEVPPAMDFRSTRDRTAVAVTYNGQTTEASVPIGAFSKLEAGCEALAQH